MQSQTFFSALLTTAALSAQNYLPMPATAQPGSELTSYSLLPFMQPNARIQMFYNAAEVGSTAFVADELALRYDGPIPQVGAPGPFSITNLKIRIGVSAIAAPGAEFAGNLTQPLTTVFDGPWSYLPDNGSAFPHPWGGPGGTLTFPFSTLAPIAIGSNEWLVVELVMTGNNIAAFGFSHAIVDGETTSGGVTNGQSVSFGQGCNAGIGLPAATVTNAGIFAPGAAHSLTGQNLGANAAVLAVYGLTNPAATLPGTNCTLFANPDLTMLAFADQNGTVTDPETFVLSLPASAAISGTVLYEQLASLVPGANSWGLVFSNATTVTLGDWTQPGAGFYSVAHDTNAAAAYGNIVRAFGYAMRLRTL